MTEAFSITGLDMSPDQRSTSGANDEVSNDAVQLLVVALFNGLCRTITSLALRRQLTPQEIAGIHDAMTTPLDDEQMRDDEFVADCRATLEQILAEATCFARSGLIRDAEF